MLYEGQVFENDHFYITITKAPGCRAVIADAVENTCLCFANFERKYITGTIFQKYKIPGYGLGFLNCGNGNIVVGIQTKQTEPSLDNYFTEHYTHLYELLERILADSDPFHLIPKKEHIYQAMTSTSGLHSLALERGVPTNDALQHFPNYYPSEP